MSASSKSPIIVEATPLKAMNIRVALYIRVSTDEQAREGYSLKTQREFLEKYAEQQGWKVYDVFEDDGYSAGTTNRPAFQRLLRQAQEKRFDVVLVYKLDRFSRKLKDLLTTIEELEAWGVGFKSATEPFETTTSSGKLMLQQLGSFAEFERARIAERVFPGMVRSVKEGNWHGARYYPFGYRYNKETKQLEIDPEQAAIVRLIFTMYLAEQSTSRITGYLYQKGYKTPSGGDFSTHFVGTILKNPIYIGKVVWNKKHYDKKQKTRKGYKYVKNPDSVVIVAQGKHDPLIAEEDFRRVQERLKANRKGVMHRQTAREYPLSGILRCGKDDHKYLGTSGTSNHRLKHRKRYYRCSSMATHHLPCSNPSVQADAIESQVYGVLELIARHPDVKSGRLNHILLKNAETADEQLQEVRQGLRVKLKSNLEKQGKLADAFAEGNLAKEVFRERAELLREEESSLRSKISAVEVELTERERSATYIQHLQVVMDSFEAAGGKITIWQKKDLLKAIFQRVVVTDEKITDCRLYYPFQKFYEEMCAEIKRQQESQLQPTEETWQSACIVPPTAVK